MPRLSETSIAKFFGYKLRPPRNYVENKFELNVPISLENIFYELCNHTGKINRNKEMLDFYDKAIEKYKNEKSLKYQTKKISVEHITAQDISADLNIISTFSKVNKPPIMTLIDTGASHTIFERKCFVEHYGKFEKCRKTMSVVGGESSDNICGKARIKLNLITIEGKIIEILVNVLIANSLNCHNLIIGNNLLRDSAITFSLTPHFWTIFNDGKKVIIPFESSTNKVIGLASLTRRVPTGNTTIYLIPTDNDLLIRPFEYTHLNIINEGLLNHPAITVTPKHINIVQNKDSSLVIKLKVNNTSSEVIYIPKNDVVILALQNIPPLEIIDDVPSIQINFNEETDPTKKLSTLYQEIELQCPDKILPHDFIENLNLDELKLKGENFSYKDCKIHDSKMTEKTLEILERYQDCFSKNSLDIGCTSILKAHIEVDETKLRIQKQRPLPNNKLIQLEEIVNEMEQAGIIQRADGHSLHMLTNVILVPKTNRNMSTKADKLFLKHKGVLPEKFRFCSDLRPVNEAICNKTTIAMISPEQIIARMSNCIISSLDITQAFFSIELTESSRKYMGFYVGNKVYKYCRLPQGMSLSPAIFITLMAEIFSPKMLNEIKKEYPHLYPIKEEFSDFISNYVDDLFIHSKTVKDHLLHIEAMLIAIRKAGIKLSPEKSTFFARTVKILGIHLDVKQSTLKLEKCKAESILNWQRPESLYSLQSRLYSLVYFAKFIPYLSEISYPLTALIRNGEFKWTSVEEKAWLKLKSTIAADIMLSIPEPSDDLIITTDASKVAVSCILWKKTGQEDIKPVMCFSKLLGLTDVNKPIFLKEVVALTLGLKTFRPYLYRTTKPVTVLTDCRGILFIGRSRFSNSRYTSLCDFIALEASLYELNIYHLPGQLNVFADILSRNVVNSRFLTGETQLSNSQAANLPPLTDNFVINSENLYKFLTNDLLEERESKPTRHVPTPEKIEDVYEAFKKVSPEQKYYSALRLLLQNNDPTLKSKYTFQENKQIATKAAISVMENKFGEENIPKKLKTKIKNSLIENVMKFNKNRQTVQVNTSKGKKKVRFATDKDSSHEHKANNKIMENREFYITHPPPSSSRIYYALEYQDPEPIAPRTIHPHSYGIDLPIQHEFSLLPGEQRLVDTGVKLALPIHTYGAIKSRSSTARNNIHIFEGSIDIDYNDTIKLLIRNLNNFEYFFKKGQYLAQIFIHKVKAPTLERVRNIKIISGRDKGSFGSTDKKQMLKPILAKKEFIKSKSIRCLNTRILSKENISFTCSNCNFILSDTYAYLTLDRECCSHPCVLPEHQIPNSAVTLNNIKVFLDNVTAQDKQLEHDFLTKVLQKMAKMTTLSKIDRKNAIQSAQNVDEFCQLIRNDLSTNKQSRFIIVKDLLYKKNKDSLSLVIPDSIISLIIYELHQELGHASKTSLIRAFNILYYHPKSSRFIKTFVDSCNICLTQKPIENRTITLGQERTMNPEKCNSHFYMDVIPMPKSGIYTGFVIFSDAFSGYVIGYPIREKNSQNIKESILHLLNSVGMVKYLYTDNDVVTMKSAKMLIKSFDINFLSSSPYAQFQNNVEASYKLVKRKLNLLCNGNNMEWPIALPLALSMVNNSIISNTKLSRYNIQFKDKSTVVVLDNFGEEEIFEHSIDQWRKQKRLKRMMYKAKGLKLPIFEPGDVVIAKNEVIDPTVTTMLRPLNKNVSRILEVHNRDLKLQDLITGKQFYSHVKKVRKIPLMEFIQVTRDLPVKGTINFKRTTHADPPFSEALDPTSVEKLRDVLESEEGRLEEENNSKDISPSDLENNEESEVPETPLDNEIPLQSELDDIIMPNDISESETLSQKDDLADQMDPVITRENGEVEDEFCQEYTLETIDQPTGN